MFQIINPLELPLPQRHQLLLGSVAPRPIAFVGSIDSEGRPNLAPFSFFNAMGSSPPTVVFSPANSGRDGSKKDTLLNILETKEYTISVVSEAIAQQCNVASGAFPRGVNEFVKAGLTPHPMQVVPAPGVAEAPVIMECRLIQHLPVGDEPGSANLVIGEVLRFHLRDEIVDSENRIDPKQMKQVSRLGYDWWGLAEPGLLKMPKVAGVVIGIDSLPDWVKSSTVLTGNDLGRLASVKEPPTEPLDSESLARWKADSDKHGTLKAMIGRGEIEQAWAHIQAGG